MSIFDFSLRLGAALLFGAMIGLERQFRQRSAGLRTNTLVSVAAAAFILLSYSLTGATGDPSRIAAQIVSGVGFLGGGLILKEGFNVRGLNTAATIWCSAAVGALSAVGLFAQALIVVIAVLFVHCVFRPLSIFVGWHRNRTYQYYVKVYCRDEVSSRIRQIIIHAISLDSDVQLNSINCRDDEDEVDNCIVISEVSSRGNHASLMEHLVNKLTFEQGVHNVGWELQKNEQEEV